MFNIASKILFLFFEPVSLVLILLVFSFFARTYSPRIARVANIAAIPILYLLSCPVISNFLVGTLESKYSDQGIRLAPVTQAIVVLGGSLRLPNRVHTFSELTNSSDRILYGYRLYRAGKAPLIVVSGGDNPLFPEHRNGQEADRMRDLLAEWGVSENAILVEDRSINTHENATLTREILARRQVNHILLVTSAIHMPRALGAFRKAGFDAEAAPADFETGWDKSLSGFDLVPSANALTSANQAIHEWVGLLVYKLRGWA
jgi:uncharacterized SAM-binding protein YcdF (DUF218 family)